MSSEDSNTIAGINLKTSKPTNIALHRLFDWVIWQFPQPQKKGFRGAIRPPIAEHDWIPAVIQAESNRVKVYANAPQTYSTPEEAVKFFQELDEE